MDAVRPHSEASQGKLVIYTLGNFAAKKGKQDLSAKSRLSAKLWELFKYLLVNQDKPVSVEHIIDSLWPDKEYEDHAAALHTLTHRMRKLFYEEFPAGEEPFVLDVSQGYYSLRLSQNCWVDILQFREYSKEALELSSEDPLAAAGLYREAISLYKGELLPEYTAKKWLLHAKRYYRTLFMQNVLNCINILHDSGKYTDVIALCEDVFQVEYFLEEEELHLAYMETLVKSSRTNDALRHYEFVTTTLYNEFGVKPSEAMRDLYRFIKPDFNAPRLSINAIHDKLKERETVNGAFICDLDFFRFLYRLEMRRRDRAEDGLVLGLFNLAWADYKHYNEDKLLEAMDTLESTLLGSLRKGDVITRWGDSRFLVLLMGVKEADPAMILGRLKSAFDRCLQVDGLNLEVSRKDSLPGK